MTSFIYWLFADKLFLAISGLSMFMNGSNEKNLRIPQFVNEKIAVLLDFLNKLKLFIFACISIKYCLALLTLYYELRYTKLKQEVWLKNSNMTLATKTSLKPLFFIGPYHGKPEVEWFAMWRVITTFILFDGASVMNNFRGYSAFVGRCEFVQLLFNPRQYETTAWIAWQYQIKLLRYTSEKVFLRLADDCSRVLLSNIATFYHHQLVLLEKLSNCKESFCKFEFGLTFNEMKMRGRFKLAAYSLFFIFIVSVTYTITLPRRVFEVYHKPLKQLEGILLYSMIEYILASFLLFQTGFFMQSVIIAMTDNSKLTIIRLDDSFKDCSSLIANSITSFRLGKITNFELAEKIRFVNQVILTGMIQMKLVEIKLRPVRLMVQAMANYFLWATITSVFGHIAAIHLSLFPVTNIPVEMPFFLLCVNITLPIAANFNKRCDEMIHKTLISLMANIVDLKETLVCDQVSSELCYIVMDNTCTNWDVNFQFLKSQTSYNPCALNPITVQMLRDNFAHSEIWFDKLALKIYGHSIKYNMILKVSNYFSSMYT